jgi:DNA primase
MANYILIYLKLVKVEAPGLNIEKRQLRQEMGENFLAWADEYYSDPNNLNQDQEKKEIFKEYQDSEYAKAKNLTIVQFKKKIKAYAKYKGYEFNLEKGGKDIKKNSKEFFNLTEQTN